MKLTDWLHLVETLAPLALAATPLAPIAPFLILGIQTAEKIKGATGSEKLVLATQIVNAGVAGANAQAGKEIINPILVNSAVTGGINAVVAAVNLVKDTKGKNDPPVPVVTPVTDVP